MQISVLKNGPRRSIVLSPGTELFWAQVLLGGVGWCLLQSEHQHTAPKINFITVQDRISTVGYHLTGQIRILV
jgi:hypothetical protein